MIEYTSPKKLFTDSYHYKCHLETQGYKNLGWMNGWNNDTYTLWEKQRALEDSIEDVQWNRSGSDCTFVLHQNKVFCSVDMGD